MQGEELEPARKRAEEFGVKEIYIDDLREEFVKDYVFPMFRYMTNSIVLQCCLASSYLSSAYTGCIGCMSKHSVHSVLYQVSNLCVV